jgi:hypothetical protein
VAVHDGDTVTVLDGERVQHRVRIAGIDAPEKGQPFGEAAKEGLSRLVQGKQVEARCRKHDRYGREVCALFVGTQDIGLEQVRSGLAWWYREYARAAGCGGTRIRSRPRAGASTRGKPAERPRPDDPGAAEVHFERISGTKRTGIVRFVAVEPSAFFSMTSSSWTCHCAPTGMTSRPPAFS